MLEAGSFVLVVAMCQYPSLCTPSSTEGIIKSTVSLFFSKTIFLTPFFFSYESKTTITYLTTAV